MNSLKLRTGFLIVLVFSLVLLGLVYYSSLYFNGESSNQDLPKQIHLTFQGDPASTVTVTWQTNTPSAGDSVLFDTVPRGGNSSRYLYRFLGSHFVLADASRYIHYVELTNLEPETTYYFICGGAGKFSIERSFKTAPERVSDFQFVVGGDSRTDALTRTLISQAMKRTNPSFVVHVGDMVDDGSEQKYWDSWFDDVNNNWVGDDGNTIPVIPCLGNHENNATNYYEQFILPDNEQWYFYDWGSNTRLFVLNSEASSSQISIDQVNWLETVLNATPTSMWKIVSFHKNIYYTGAHENATLLMEWWVPIFDKYHVDVVFQGHDHVYHRSKPMKNNTVVSSYEEGTMYVTTGGWGAPLYDYVAQLYSAYGNEIHHFTLMSVYGNDTLHLEAKDVNGLTFDEVWVYK